MRKYLSGLWKKIKNGSIKLKVFVSLIVVLYIGIVCVCVIPVYVDSSIPGTVTNVSSLIDIESENEAGNIYTVSIFSESKISILQYLLTKLDKNSDIELGKPIALDIFTENEEYATNYGYKLQSIQDSIIVGYNQAIADGYEVVLDYSYQGQYLINIPQNTFKTGGEDFKNGDIIVGFNDNKFTSEDDYLSSLDTVFASITYEEKTIKQLKEEGKFNLYDKDGKLIEENKNLLFYLIDYIKDVKTEYNFKILRNNEEKTITPSSTMLFYLYSNKLIKTVDNIPTLYTIYENYFTSYVINYDKCSPKIDISKTNTVGPSGGLLQALAVYNSITSNDVTKGLRIMGTGGININGDATLIGGERQKIVTAQLYSADIFFIPEGNYESAKTMYETIEDVKYELVPVNSLKDVINYLNNMEVTNE